ncbi:PP2C family protein-serine/threonine phosphatase [Spirillospora sp. NPDC048911]|uniref:PP2C family protein-serine/threonine phosphatase n=1 Tax=Spirillospora sp. NPDC048911 TaxID=3364527 RepID=UPI00371395D7
MDWTSRRHLRRAVAVASIVAFGWAVCGGWAGVALLVAVPVLLAGPRSACRCVWAGVVTGVLAAAVGIALWRHWLGGALAVVTGFTLAVALARFAVPLWVRSRVPPCRCWERRSMTDLRDAVEVMRRVVVRPLPREIAGMAAEVRYLTAGGVGGDLYEVVDTPFGVRLIIGDVRGKGLPAAELAADVLGAFRDLAQHEAKLSAIAVRLNALLVRRGGEEDFATALLVGFRADEGSAELVCCGHPAPLRICGERARPVEMLDPAPPLALLGLDDGQCTVEATPFGPGEALLFFTDGVTEARDSRGRFYPLRDRVSAFQGDELLERLVADLRRHAGDRLQDDAVLLLIRAAGQPAASRRS